jgi:threonine synthase
MSSLHYIYKCSACGRTWPPERIEPDGYLCPDCGKWQKQRPLEGVLRIEYDYASLRRSMDRAEFLSRAPGRMWEYPELWPLKAAAKTDETFAGIARSRLESFGLPQNSLGTWEVDGARVQFLDDTRNLTGSFKDRASLLVALKALQLGIREISASSTGNAGTSLAGIFARLGLSAHIWVPAAIPKGKLLQLVAYGAHVYLVAGDYDAAFDIGLEMAMKHGWYNRNTGFNPLTIEGKKSAAYDIFLASRGSLPEIVFVPTGDGVILAGLHKGFWELRELGLIETLPLLVAVQSERGDAVCRYVRTGKFEYVPATTIADSISAGAPRNLYMAAQALKETKGTAVAVSDESILAAQRRIARDTGLLVEPAAASSLAGYLKLRADGVIAADARALLLFTGHGLKDPAALERWAERPPSRTADEWRTLLADRTANARD